MPGIKDVAEKAGVTVTTVSRVLNNRGYISEQTRERVRQAMEELDYQPNELARALFRRRSNLIGLVVPDVSHPFFAELTARIEFHAYANGCKLLLCNSFRDNLKEREYMDMLRRNQVDGILMGGHSQEISEYLTVQLPIVAIDRFLSENIPYVASDNYNGGELATKRLLEAGCRHLVHISGPLSLNTPANRRHAAFQDVLTNAGVKGIVIESGERGFDKKEYETLILHLLEEYPDVDGIFASSDLIAACAIEVAARIGRKVPEDLKVVGYDDINLADMLVPGITTIRQPIDDIARMAVELLLRLVKKEAVPMENILPVSLISRGTC